MAAKRFILVVNPRGGTGRGLAVLDAVKPVFQAAGAELDVHVTTGAGDAARIAETIDLAGCDGFCLVGGDGTIHEVVGGLMRRGKPVATPVGIIPGGTGNSVLAHLRCSDPLEAAQRIVAGSTQPLDVVRVTMGSEVTHCVNIVGWGGVVDINRTAERLRALGPPRYALAALSHILRAKRRRATVVLDGQALQDRFLFVVACNTKFTGSGMQLAPDAHVGDGKVDVVLVRRASRLQMFKLFSRVFDGSHVGLPFVEYYQVRSFSIESKGRDLLNLDGELKGTTPLAAEMMPGAVQVFV